MVLAACGDPPKVASPRDPEPTPTPPSPAPAALGTVAIDGVPHVLQKPDFCGEACLEMFGRKLGRKWDQDDAFAASGTDPALGRGATTRELEVAARALGFEPGRVFGQVDASNAADGLGAAFAALHADLSRGVPSIVCTHFDERPNTTEHFRLIVGYDASSDEVVYHDPALPDGASRRMPRARLLSLWPLKYARDRWLAIRLALDPVRAADPPARPKGFTPADYAQHVLALRERLEHVGVRGMNVRIEEPFVVLGDDTPEVLKQRAETVRWAADMLEQEYFQERPKKLLDVYLFKDAASYEHGVKALTGDEPGTPYGFYSSRHEGLFMNIATGGGTLVHEIVHPYVEADFPGAPAWLNEGLGSLYEQSGEREGRIIGLTNWRLAGLQKAIRRGTVPSFQALASMSDHAFYDEDRGTNYAQARYLFFYMQERGLLRDFYAAFRAARQKDPTGYATLVRALGETDMAAFQERWQAYVLGLRF
jgi:hypothetical protein